MVTRSVTIRFLTPGFVGDANQGAAWRTPPFKAQLRQWWRVVMAARGVEVPEMRRLEGQLFGDAAGKEGVRSRVLLRLGTWASRSGNTWSSGADTDALGDTARASASGYLGYGRVGEKGAIASAIPAGGKAELRIAWPPNEDGADALDETLGLMSLLGTVGGRSRNGWGSYLLEPAPGVQQADYGVQWRDAMQRAWVSGIGADNKGLLAWHTDSHKGWERVIRQLGDIRKFLNKAAGEHRTLVNYPVTEQTRHELGRDRIPNTLRFKVVPGPGNSVRGQVVHLPCRPKDELWNRISAADREGLVAVLKQAHASLDGTLQRAWL